MYRFIYCPSEDLLDEANDAAKALQLPIQIGLTDESYEYIYDKNSISVIQKPEKKEHCLLKKKVKKNLHQIFIYIDEYDGVDDCLLFVNDEKVSSFIKEKYKIKYIFNNHKVGNNSLKFINNKKEILEFNYDCIE